MISRGLSYKLHNTLYLSVTNLNICTSLIDTRGPNFQMPIESGFKLIQGAEPTVDELTSIINDHYANDANIIGMGENDPGIKFCGNGEPLLRPKIITDTIANIKEVRHGCVFNVYTCGLFDPNVALDLKEGGVSGVTVALNAADPNTYNRIMKPTNNKSFSDVCTFILSCVEAGLDVTATAVDTPDVKVKDVRDLAISLGAIEFKSRTYHP